MSQRKDTCIGKRCPFWKRYEDTCPNYVQGEWITPDKHEYTTKDCAPKRAMILSQQIYDQLICTRKDYANVRKATVDVLKLSTHYAGVDFIEGEVLEAPIKLITADDDNEG